MEARTIKVAAPITGEAEAKAIQEVLLSGNFVSGKKVVQFEEAFARYLGVAYAAAVNSGTAALHTALALLGIGSGDEVIVPPLTFMSTVTSVLHQNATPVFADIDAESLCLSPKAIAARVTSRTKAIVVVHLYGNAADMDGIMEVAKANNLYVIEDCAQAHGTEYNGRKVGTIGDVGTFSFFATKHMTTGEGGMLVTKYKPWIDSARIIRNHGLINRDDHVCLGYNYRMHEMAAAMGLVQLEKLEEYNEMRIHNSLFLLRELGMKKQDWFSLPYLDGRIKHTFFWCPLILNPDKNFSTQDIVIRLKQRGIEVRQRYRAPLYKQEMFRSIKNSHHASFEIWKAGRTLPDYMSLYLPNAERMAGNIIGIPNHPALKQEDLEYIVHTVRNLC